MAEFTWEQMSWSRSFSKDGVSYDRFRGPDGREIDIRDKGQNMKESQVDAFTRWVLGTR